MRCIYCNIGTPCGEWRCINCGAPVDGPDLKSSNDPAQLSTILQSTRPEATVALSTASRDQRTPLVRSGSLIVVSALGLAIGLGWLLTPSLPLESESVDLQKQHAELSARETAKLDQTLRKQGWTLE